MTKFRGRGKVQWILMNAPFLLYDWWTILPARIWQQPLKIFLTSSNPDWFFQCVTSWCLDSGISNSISCMLQEWSNRHRKRWDSATRHSLISERQCWDSWKNRSLLGPSLNQNGPQALNRCNETREKETETETERSTQNSERNYSLRNMHPKRGQREHDFFYQGSTVQLHL